MTTAPEQPDVVRPVSDNPNLFIFQCPGCKYAHPIDTTRWKFNGDLKKPTMTPSLLVHGGSGTPRCHSFVTDGEIRFLADCEHELAGQTVELGPVWGEE